MTFQSRLTQAAGQSARVSPHRSAKPTGPLIPIRSWLERLRDQRAVLDYRRRFAIASKARITEAEVVGFGQLTSRQFDLLYRHALDPRPRWRGEWRAALLASSRVVAEYQAAPGVTESAIASTGCGYVIFPRSVLRTSPRQDPDRRRFGVAVR